MRIDIIVKKNEEGQCCYADVFVPDCCGSGKRTQTRLYPSVQLLPNEDNTYYLRGVGGQVYLDFERHEIYIDGVLAIIEDVDTLVCCLNGVKLEEKNVLCGSLNLNLVGGSENTWTHDGVVIQGTWFTVNDILTLSNATYLDGTALIGDHYLCDFSISALKCGVAVVIPLTESSITIKEEFNFAIVTVNGDNQIQTEGGNVTMKDGEQFQKVFVPQYQGIKFTSGKFCQKP